MRNAAVGNSRIGALDVLRGVAVLGILLMNIQSFSMIESAYSNPTAYGNFEGVNVWIWGFTRLFADQKFMTLFSLLFGAGIVLMRERSLAEGRSAAVAHYRRMLVLLLVGAAHAYLLWYGDILTLYALCGMVVYVASRWRAGILLGLGFCLLLVPALIFAVLHFFMDYFPPDVMREFEQAWRPDAELIHWELQVYRGTYWEQMEHRVQTALEVHSFLLALWFGWRISGLMLIGMALFKWKILGAYRSSRFYWGLLMVGLGVGLPLEGWGIFYQAASDWAVDVMIPGMLFNYFASLFVAAGYLATVALMHQAMRWSAIKSRLAAVGRMAFTNYLAQTLICTTLFYGHGLGWYGSVERWQQLMIVLAIWVFQVVWSEWWLRRFQNGPLEWLWRCATYLRVLPLRKTACVEGTSVPPLLGL